MHSTSGSRETANGAMPLLVAYGGIPEHLPAMEAANTVIP